MFLTRVWKHFYRVDVSTPAEVKLMTRSSDESRHLNEAPLGPSVLASHVRLSFNRRVACTTGMVQVNQRADRHGVRVNAANA
jgi:hypothetical protein